MSAEGWFVIVALVAIVAIPILERVGLRRGWLKPDRLETIQAHRRYMVSGKREDKQRWNALRDRDYKEKGM